MAKKLFFIIFLVISIALVFTSCDQNNSNVNNSTPSDTNDSGTGSHTHSFGDWKTIKEATCTENGMNERYCSCGEKQAQSIISSHEFENWISEKEVNCTENGINSRTCTVCGYKETEVVVAGGHCWSDATCTESKKCANCNLTNGNPLGHNYEKTVIKTETCTADGEIKYTCTRCEDSYNEKTSGSHEFIDGVCKKCSSFDDYTGCAVVAVKSYFQQTLKNPSSLQLISIEYYIGLSDKNYFRLEITYSAMNGFGGYNRDTATIYIHMNGDGTFNFSPYSSSDAATSLYSTTRVKYSSVKKFTDYYQTN